MSLPSVALYPTTTNSAAPFCVGHPFVQGDVPAGSSVTAPFADFQCIPKNTWPDGSLKFAILSGRAAVTGTTPYTFPLSVGVAATGTPITNSGITTTAVIDCGTFGSVTWSGSDWASPFQTWISGPKMSSWIYRKSVGSDPHLTAWLEVRVWAGGEIEVLPWVENGYFKVAAPTNKSATYTFTLANTQRFQMALDLKHHQRTPLVSGSALSHWVGADPGVTPFHNQAYLMASELVPTYGVTSPAYGLGNAYLSSTPSTHDYLRDTFTPLAAGNFKYDSDQMPSSGYQAPIGLLPTHDVAYLICTSQQPLLYGAVVRAGMSSGRYGIHYRDETTQLPVSFSAYPTTVIFDDNSILNTGASTSSNYTPATSGGNPPRWDPAHSPSVGYMAYLLTGRFYFKEETQFAACANHYCITDWVRGGGTGVDYSPYPTYTGASGICLGTVQTRQGAWSFRALTQALAITPDSGDPMKAELKFVVEENCRYFHAMYVAQTNNPFGIIKGSSAEYYTDVATDRLMVPVWQQDFVTATWGMALCLGLPISSIALSRMAAYFQWKAASIVHRLGTASGFHFENGAPYEYAASPVPNPDFDGGTGPWYADAAAAYAATYTGSQVPESTTANLLGLGYQPEVSMWGNIQPAIAYAVRHNAPGAVAARARMMGASNYSTLTAGFVQAPVWAVVPSGAATQIAAGPTQATGAVIRLGTLRTDSITIDKYYGNGVPKSDIGIAATGQPKSPAEVHSSGMPADIELLTILGAASNGTPILYEDQSIAWSSMADGVQTLPFTLCINGVPDTGVIQANVNVSIGDGLPPTMQGSLSFSSVTANGFLVSWLPATDNVAVTGYEVSVDNGVSYVNVGNVLSYSKTGATGATPYAVRVRAYDAVTNRSLPLVGSVTTSQLTSFATSVIFAVVDASGTAISATGLDYAFYDQPRISAGRAPIKAGSDLSIVNGVATISIAGLTTLTPGGQGRIEWGDSAGTRHGGGPVTVI